MSAEDKSAPELASLASTPAFSEQQAQALIKEHFGWDAKASALPSERDQNFRVTADDGARYVLKIANAEEDFGTLDFQNAAIERAQQLGTRLELPEIIPALSDEQITSIAGQSGSTHFMRMVSWVDGMIMAEMESHPAQLLASIGEKLAMLDKALADFKHPSMMRSLCWDVRHTAGALEHLSLLSEPRQVIVRQLAAPALALDWSRLEHSVIHSDANDYNILVKENCASGLIDFGDMVYSATAADPAIAAAYAMLSKADPLEAGATLVSSYLAHFPLKPADRDAILPLMLARLCMSVCFAAQNAAAKPDDPYQTVTAGPAWEVLEALAQHPVDELSSRWQQLLETARPQHHAPEALREARKEFLGPSLSLSYNEPLNIVRGEGAYLIDQSGQAFLDCVNNVSHVGHCHPRVVEAGVAQMRTLNTNTRYLNRLLTDYAQRLAAKLPDPLDTVFFVNSGSEANELALRLARTHTGRRDVAVLDVAYHGTTTSLIDLSPYKHDRKGGSGRPEWVHVAPMPDPYRGLHRGEESGALYAGEVASALACANGNAAAFIAESALGCGGQIILPPGFLKAAYEHARGLGAVCIADEVQTGMGRAGSHFWMFETQGVVPDIVSIGKPIGNGHPMAAVVTTREIAQSFANGMEYFNTFGGNPVSCAIGMAVLDVIEDEGLQAHSAKMGTMLKQAFDDMAQRHDLIGDVRGQGFFLGIELVTDRETREPASHQAKQVVNTLRSQGILMSTDGPDDNVLKIKPPIVFPEHEASRLVDHIEAALKQV